MKLINIMKSAGAYTYRMGENVFDVYFNEENRRWVVYATIDTLLVAISDKDTKADCISLIRQIGHISLNRDNCNNFWS